MNILAALGEMCSAVVKHHFGRQPKPSAPCHVHLAAFKPSHVAPSTCLTADPGPGEAVRSYRLGARLKSSVAKGDFNWFEVPVHVNEGEGAPPMHLMGEYLQLFTAYSLHCFQERRAAP